MSKTKEQILDDSCTKHTCFLHLDKQRGSIIDGDAEAAFEAMDEYAEQQSIEFAMWLQHLDNGTEHYNPHTKETSESIGFSPADCLADGIYTIPELYQLSLNDQNK